MLSLHSAMLFHEVVCSSLDWPVVSREQNCTPVLPSYLEIVYSGLVVSQLINANKQCTAGVGYQPLRTTGVDHGCQTTTKPEFSTKQFIH